SSVRSMLRRSPRRTRIGTVKKLHLGEQVAEMLGMVAPLAVPGVADVRRSFQRRLAQHVVDARGPARFELSQRRRDACASHFLVDLVSRKELTREAPQIIERVLHAEMTLLRSSAEPDEP